MSETIKYKPGEEPPNVKKRLAILFSKIDNAYPDKVVSRLYENHKKWGETLTEIRRILGYETNTEILNAYGYTVVVPNFRDKNKEFYDLINKLKNRYPSGTDFYSINDLIRGNIDLEKAIKSLSQNQVELFNQDLDDINILSREKAALKNTSEDNSEIITIDNYFRRIGIIKEKEKIVNEKYKKQKQSPKEKLDSIMEMLRARYKDSDQKPSTISQLISENHELEGIRINYLISIVLNKNPKEYLQKEQILQTKNSDSNIQEQVMSIESINSIFLRGKTNSEIQKYAKKFGLDFREIFDVENGIRCIPVLTEVNGTNFRVKKSRKIVKYGHIYLEREPNNKYDANAIAVLNKDKELSGYIPRYIASEIAPIIDAAGCEVSPIIVLESEIYDENKELLKKPLITVYFEMKIPEREYIKNNLELLGNWEFITNEKDEIVIDRYKGNQKEVIIPSKYLNKSIKKIDEKTFRYSAGVKKIFIPESVEYIDCNTFLYCNELQSITVHENNKFFSSLDGVLFEGENHSIRCIPNKYKESKIKIDFKEYSVLNVEGLGILIDSCSSHVDELIIPDEINGTVVLGFNIEMLKTICNLYIGKNISILYERKERKENSYQYEAIMDNYLGIDSSSSNKMRLSRIKTHPDNKFFDTEDDVLYSKFKTKLILYPSNKFDIKFKIPDSVKEINSWAFPTNTYLKDLILSENMKKVDMSLLKYLTRLRKIHITKEIEEINLKVFETHELKKNYFNCLTSIIVCEKNQVYSSDMGILFDKKMEELILFAPGLPLLCYYPPESVKSINRTFNSDIIVKKIQLKN